MVSPSAKRRAAQRSAKNGGGSKSAACRALGLASSGLYRQAKSSVEGRRILKEVLELSDKHPRYGYRRVTALLRSSFGAANLDYGRPLGSLRPKLPSTPKPTTTNNQQSFRSKLSHLRGQARPHCDKNTHNSTFLAMRRGAIQPFD